MFTRGQTRAFQALERELRIGNSNCFIVEDGRFLQYFQFLHLHPAVKSGGEQFHFFREVDALAWPQRMADIVLRKLKYLAISVIVGMLISVAEENVFGNQCQKMNCRWAPNS